MVFDKYEGNKSGYTLIHLPGTGSPKECYHQYAKSLLDVVQEIFIPDLPCQGNEGQWTIEDMVRLISEIKTKAKGKNIVLSGHSVGGIAVLNYLFGYNRENEEFVKQILNRKYNLGKIDEEKFNRYLMEIEYNLKDVKYILIYSLPNSIVECVPSFVFKSLNTKSKRILSRRANILINGPIGLLTRIMKNRSLVPATYKNSEELFYNSLKIENPKEIYNDILQFPEAFTMINFFLEMQTIIDKGDIELQENTIESLNRIIHKFNRIVKQFHFGMSDWLIAGQNRKEVDIIGKCEVKNYALLGHFLSSKLSLDINLNAQMLINKNVLKNTHKLLQG